MSVKATIRGWTGRMNAWYDRYPVTRAYVLGAMVGAGIGEALALRDGVWSVLYLAAVVIVAAGMYSREKGKSRKQQ